MGGVCPCFKTQTVSGTTIEGLYDEKELPYGGDGSFTYAKDPQKILNAYNMQNRDSIGSTAIYARES